DRGHAADAADVIYLLTPTLVVRHVGNRADDGAVLCDRGQALDGAIVSRRSLKLGHSEIQNLDATLIRQKQILRLEIAMHNEPVMRHGKSLRDLQGVVRGLSDQ